VENFSAYIHILHTKSTHDCSLQGAMAMENFLGKEPRKFVNIFGPFSFFSFSLPACGGFVSFEKVANLIRNSWKTTRKRLKFYMSKVIEKFKLPNLICSEMLPNNNTNSKHGVGSSV